MTAAVEWLLLTRPGCHLCEEFLQSLSGRLPSQGVHIRTAYVDDRAEWKSVYGRRIPVLLDGAGHLLYSADGGEATSLEQLLQVFTTSY